MSTPFTFRLTLAGLVFWALALTATAQAPDPAEGKKIFTNVCSACHKVKSKLVGPALSKVYERRAPEWIVKFVQNPQGMIDSGDPQAVALYKDYSNVAVMNPHPQYNATQILGIVEYIKQEDNPPAQVAAAGGAAGGQGGGSGLDTTLVTGLVTLAVSLTVLLLMFAIIIFTIVYGMRKSEALRSVFTKKS